MTRGAATVRDRLAVCHDVVTRGARHIPEEVPVAIVYGGTTHAVLMASPADLEDFAYGFSLTEGVIETTSDVREFDIIAQPDGIELRLWLADARSSAFIARRRATLGPTGCGLCGIESLAEAARSPMKVKANLSVTAAQVSEAVRSLDGLPLGTTTRAVHAAGLWTPSEGLVAVREDVGRHNALDKLAGALLRSGDTGSAGIIVLTSRVSVEMIQKAAAIGAPIVAAVSAPTALAVRMADQAGITLCAVARADGFEVFTHPARLDLA